MDTPSGSANDDDDFLVIGAGLGRTGTESLKKALELLLGAKCYHMMELLHCQPDDSRRWVEVDRCIEDDDHRFDVDKTRQLFGEMFHSKYKAAVDWPAASYYKQMAEVYPNAKVILTIRDSASWVRSVRQTILAQTDWANNLARFLLVNPSYPNMKRRMLERVFGSMERVYESNDTELGEAFDAWNESVQSTIPSDRLLVFNVKQGWEPLCSFLQLPIPSGQSFPHVNSSQAFVDRFTKFRRVSNIIRYGLPLLIGIAAAVVFGGILKSLTAKPN